DGTGLAGWVEGGVGAEAVAVKVWDAASAQELLTLTGNTANLNCMAFSPDGKRLATAGYQDGFFLDGPREPVVDRTVQLWDTTSGQELLTLRGHTEFVQSVAFSPDGKRLATASGSLWGGTGFGPPGDMKLWDEASGQAI